MSRTDVHAPEWVKERDPLWRDQYKEVHNHGWHTTGSQKHVDEDGYVSYRPIGRRVERCELEDYLAAREWVRTACYITLRPGCRNICCGCQMCTGQFYRKLSRKADRSRTKRLLRAQRWDDINCSSNRKMDRWRF